MDEIQNTKITDLIGKIINSPGTTMPFDMAHELMDELAYATLISPSNGEGGIMLLQLGPRIFLPACGDMDDFKRIFKNETPITLEFGEILAFLNEDMDGIIINPGSFGFVINHALAGMISEKITDVPDFTSKGYDVKVRLDDFRPLTWRDLIIPEGITFKELDNIMKILWDFGGYHLSRFTFKDSPDVVTNEFLDIDFNPGELNSKDVIIDSYFDTNKKIYWEYDYGDGWSFTIEVKKAVEYDKDYPTIKRFRGEYNPQDDIGGVWGLERLMEEDPDALARFNMDDVQFELKTFADCDLFDY